MKEFVRISGVTPAKVGRSFFDELLRVYKDESSPRMFHCTLPSDDPRLALVRRMLDQAGVRPKVDHSRESLDSEYTLRIERRYEPEDLEALQLFQIWPAVQVEGLFRDEHFRIMLDGRTLKPDADFVSPFNSWVVVPERVKLLLERSDLRGVAFRPTVLTGGALASDRRKPVSWDVYGEPWWELTSDLVLPRLAPSVTLVDEPGRLFTGDYSNGCYIREGNGLYISPEFHYTADALAAAGPFDLALTRERFGPADVPEDWRWLVASARFRNVCIRNGLAANWVPVRIDP